MEKLAFNQYGISLHTNTPQLGLTINNFQGDNRSQIWDLGRDLSSNLHQYLKEFIKPQTWDNISFIAVAKGPGGFTGTRIGMVTARTIAQQLNIPLYSISNLEAIAYLKLNQLEEENKHNILLAVEMMAVRGQIFAGIYQGNPHNLGLNTYLKDNTYLPEKWTEILNQLPEKYKLILPPDNSAITSKEILDLAYLQWQQGIIHHWQQGIPFYGQNPVNISNQIS
jgi:tRNA threonylcarbamoyl adenosine modification protein YeaZ